jgi:hypothetical protein
MGRWAGGLHGEQKALRVGGEVMRECTLFGDADAPFDFGAGQSFGSESLDWAGTRAGSLARSRWTWADGTNALRASPSAVCAMQAGTNA